MIVNEKITFVSISTCGADISNAANTAYWTADVADDVSAYQGRIIIEQFERMAGLLGYRVEKIEQPVEDFAEAIGDIEALAAREVAK